MIPIYLIFEVYFELNARDISFEGITTLNVVRKERLELSHLTILEPKSSASTNSATFAFCALILSAFSTIYYYKLLLNIRQSTIV